VVPVAHVLGFTFDAISSTLAAMLHQRWRPVLYCALAIGVIWAAAFSIYRIAENSKMTAEKARQFAETVDLARLSAEERAKAIRRLADMLNRLPLEERRRARLEGASWRLFEQMTEEEKGTFIDATMPTGFKQMLTAFEQLPEEKRGRAINDAVRRLREVQTRLPEEGGDMRVDGTNRPPALSPELQARIRTIGLRAFYSQSSAQTKAELAPLLEELQRMMESGRILHMR
jgi:hypothetical protein